MSWFTRTSHHESRQNDPQPPMDWAKRRREPLACAGCKQVNSPYVYMENDKEYCVECALTNLAVLRLYPAGKRDTDIKLEDLVRDHAEVLKRLQPHAYTSRDTPRSDLAA